MKEEKALKISVYTLGCKSNQYDSALLRDGASLRGLRVVPPSKETDVFVVNTCTVTGKSNYQARQAIRRFKALNPLATLVVTGCYAQVYPEEISRLNVDYIIGNTDKKRLWEVLSNISGGGIFVGDIRGEVEFDDSAHFDGVFNRTRSYLKIQDGCDSFCSYCIVPYARGKSRSLPLNGVLERIDKLVEKGFREIVLTGIHLGAYGRDLEGGLSLLCLLREVEDKFSSSPENGGLRLRLSSIEPVEISREFIEHMRFSALLCHHLHIPLQSGSGRILKLMKRPYSPVYIRELISDIREELPSASIGMDVMAGFPGESEDDFNSTCELLSGIDVSYLHVFPFSKRKGTPAAEYPGQVIKRTIKDRCRRLRELGEEKRHSFYKKNIGTKTSVLVEGRTDKVDGLLKGFTRNYIPVFFKGDEFLVGKEVDVVIESVKKGKVFGSPKSRDSGI